MNKVEKILLLSFINCKKIKPLSVIVTTLIILTSCNSEDKIEGLKANEILVVTLDIADDINIKQVNLTSTGGTDKILGTQIDNKRKVKLKTPQRGEGTFSICVFTATDTFCSRQNYIEGDYRPKLKLKNSNFEIVEWF